MSFKFNEVHPNYHGTIFHSHQNEHRSFNHISVFGIPLPIIIVMCIVAIVFILCCICFICSSREVSGRRNANHMEHGIMYHSSGNSMFSNSGFHAGNNPVSFSNEGFSGGFSGDSSGGCVGDSGGSSGGCGGGSSNSGGGCSND
ncbi:UNVERIFIED_CONTAM: hypothetical protein RMT77_018850 [Armadillidium vulgare]